MTLEKKTFVFQIKLNKIKQLTLDSMLFVRLIELSTTDWTVDFVAKFDTSVVPLQHVTLDCPTNTELILFSHRSTDLCCHHSENVIVYHLNDFAILYIVLSSN
jgi:hypothetical protein